MSHISGAKSVRTRLSLMMAATVCGCMLLTVAAFLALDFRQSVSAEKMRLENTASVFAAAVAGPAAAGRTDEVRSALRGIKDIEHVRHVGVRTLSGAMLAEMGGGASLDDKRGNAEKLTALNVFMLRDLTVIVPVRSGGRVIAALTLQSDISWIRNAFAARMSAALLLSGLGIALTFSMAYRRISSITAPLTDLAKSFEDIGGADDLAQRIDEREEGEVGVLIRAFNNMFERIAERDAKLQLHRDTLEQTVAARTSELVTARDEAEQANAAKSEFLAMVGHEIRTPMNGMMAMAEMLAAAPLGPRHLRYAQIINRSGRNLIAIINDILDLSKIEAGRLDIEAAPFSIDAMIEDIAGLFSERAREKGLTLAFTISPNVPEKFEGDAARLTQIVSNLVNNALKFTETGGVAISVSSGAEDSAGRAALSIRVRDTGIGIAASKLEHIFERFTQADQSITRRFGGTGLGLAISKRLVEAMDGRLTVDSAEGAGSTFAVDLLLPVEEAARKIPSLSGKRIALRHSSAFHRDAVRITLQQLGALVIDVPASAAALNADAVLTDSVSPPISGLAARMPVLKLTSEHAVSEGGLASAALAGEVACPLRRQDYHELASSLQSGNFQYFEENTSARSAFANLPEFRGLSALVVDDNAVNREVLQEALLNMGADVALANDGRHALEKMRMQNFGIVFMDCSMPVMDGFAATRQWRASETGRRLPIVALTAYAEGSGGDNWEAAGMDAYLTKPFTMPAIAETIIRLASESFSGAVRASTLSVSSGLSDPAPLERTPLLDPQTIGMIAKLSARGGENAARRIFGLFAEHAPAGLESLERAVAARQWDEISGLAHALKSMATSAGALRLSCAADAVELRSVQGLEPGADLMADLADTLKASIAAFSELTAEASPTRVSSLHNKSVA